MEERCVTFLPPQLGSPLLGSALRAAILGPANIWSEKPSA